MSNAGIVLCGGRSSRMGRPKAWLPWRGKPLLDHMVGTLSGIVGEVVAVAAAEMELPSTEARIITDPHPGLGPLAGIGAGLAQIHSDLAFVTATDSPLLTPSYINHLLSEGKTVAPRIDGVIQTLSAVYAREGAALAMDLLAAGQRRPLDLLEALDFHTLEQESIEEPEACLSFNTPADYLAAVRASDANAAAIVEFLGRARSQMGCREVERPVASLGEILKSLEPDLCLLKQGILKNEFRISIDGRFFSRDLAIPIGAGEHVIILDGSAGG